MLFKRLLFIFMLSYLLVGCTEFAGQQPPAPVYGEVPSGQNKALPHREAKQKPTPKAVEKEIVHVQPLQDTVIPIKPIEMQPLPLPQESNQPLLTPEEEQELQKLTEQPNEPSTKPVEAQTKPVEDAAPEPAHAETGYKPLATFAPLSPVVGALVIAANKSSESGNVESATTTIERAIRIEPRNATLYYKLAVLRLEQNKPAMAEDLAKKSALLASTDAKLKKHSWLLIAKARDMQHNRKGAQEARETADKF